MHRGYVKVWRKIEDSGLLQVPNTLALFMFLLLNATHKDKKVGTNTGIVELKRGQFIGGRIMLAARLEQTEREIRTSVDRLVALDIISVQSTNKYSLYTIENYSKYQDVEANLQNNVQQNDQQTTINRPADDQQTTTKQELNNLRNKDIPPIAMLMAMGLSESLAKDWLKVRKLKDKAATQRAFNAVKKKSDAGGYTFERAIEICVERSWADFDASWVKDETTKQQPAVKDWT